MKRAVSKGAVDLIKQFEGLSLKSYKCVSTEKYYTIGYGHYGSDVKKSDTITKQEAEYLLLEDLKKFESKVNKYDDVYNFSQNEFDALISFCYNVGNIDTLTNHGKRSRKEITTKMLEYVKSGGQILKGLEKRRKKEVELFNTPDENNHEKYYKPYTGKSGSIVDALKSIGEPLEKTTLSYRYRLAEKNNIPTPNTYTMNTGLLILLKEGRLKRL